MPVGDLFRAFADAAPMLMWRAGVDGRWDWCNAAFAAFTGTPTAQLLGFGWRDAVHPDDRDVQAAAWAAAVAAGEPYEVEYRLRAAAGGYRWVLDRGGTWRDPAGAQRGYLGGAVDIDDRRRTADELAETASRLATLQRLTAAFATALTPGKVATVVVEEAVSAVGARAGSLAEVVGDEIQLVRWIGYDEDVVAGFQRMPIHAETPLAVAVRTEEPEWYASAEDILAAYPALEGRLSGSGALAAIPLIVEGRAIGALGLSFTLPGEISDDRRGFLLAVARQCAVALERGRLYEATVAANERLSFLASASMIMTSSLDRREVLERLARLAIPRLGDWAAVYLPEGEVLERVVVVHRDPDAQPLLDPVVGERPLPVSSDAPAAVAYRTATTQVIDRGDSARLDAEAPGPEVTGMFRHLRLRAGMCVPLVLGTRCFGVLAFAVSDLDRAPGDDEVALATELAARAVIALHNAESFAQERRTAEALQLAILPDRLPVVAGVDLDALYLPAATDVAVGGDWYDAVSSPDGRLTLVVGDVMGHGLRAASVMGQLRNALRAYVHQGLTPHASVIHLDSLTRASGIEEFATLVICQLDPASRTVVWVNAGHCPPLAASPAGWRFLEGAVSDVVGGASGPAFVQLTATLQPGERLVLYTDGLVERRDRPLDAGMSALALAAESLIGEGRLTARRLATAVLGAGPREDDACVLVAGLR